MKRIAMASLTLALLAGCASPQVAWEQDDKIVIDNAQVQLSSNLWLNKMPTIGELQEQNLHGALYLESSQPLPADLAVSSVVLRQGDQVWLIEGSDLEIRTNNENQWEVVFTWQLELDTTQLVDVALTVERADTQVWLVEKSVSVDEVY